MNVFGLFKSISSSSEGDNNHSDGGDRNAMAGSGQGKSRKNGFDAQTSAYDWVAPKRRQRELEPRLKAAFKRLESLTNDLGNT